MMYFATPMQAANTLLALCVCAYALWRGGGPERWAAAMIFADWFATPLLQVREPFSHAQLGVFALDGALTLGLMAIAFTSDRFWPLWVTAFQVLELLIHVAMVADPKVHGRAYFVGIEITSYLILAALFVGAWRETPPPSSPLAADRAM